MSNKKNSIAASTSSLMEMPDDLEGLVKQVNGVVDTPKIEIEDKHEDKHEDAKPSKPKQKAAKATTKKPKAEKTQKVPESLSLNGDALWNSFVQGCDTENDKPKSVGRKGNAGWCMIDKDILVACRQCSVNGHSITDMVNAMLRQFILHYRSQFLQFKESEDSLI